MRLVRTLLGRDPDPEEVVSRDLEILAAERRLARQERELKELEAFAELMCALRSDEDHGS